MADKQDGLIAAQLCQWGTSMGLHQAVMTIMADDFDPETARTATDKTVMDALTFGETIAGMVKHGAFDRELALDLLWCEGIWKRVGPAARKDQEEFGEPALWSNFESLAQSGMPT